MVEMSEAKTLHVPPRQPATPPASSGDTVCIACKIPIGLKLRLFREETYYENVMGGGVKESVRHIPTGDEITLNGSAINIDAMRLNQGMDKIVVGGAGFTLGVPKDFWDAWLAANKDTDLVRNRQVWSASSEAGARARAREEASIRSGLEPIDPDNPHSRMPPSPFGGGKIEPGSRS
jgi:hypothetical protein